MDRADLRRHLLVAAAVAAAAVLIGGVWLVGSERRLAATSSIAPADWVAEVDAGERLCVDGLWMPAGSDTVRLQLTRTEAANRPVALRLETPEGAAGASAPTVPRRAADVDFMVRPLTRDAQVRLCLRPGSRLRVAGMRDRKIPGVGYDFRRFQAHGRTPVELDGRPVAGRVSVWFLEPRTRSVASALPDVIRRATAFRPGFVGTWTYLAMLALLAVSWFVGLRLLWRGQA